MKDFVDIVIETDPADLADRIGKALGRETEIEAARIRAALSKASVTLDARLRSRAIGAVAGRTRIDA